MRIRKTVCQYYIHSQNLSFKRFNYYYYVNQLINKKKIINMRARSEAFTINTSEKIKILDKLNIQKNTDEAEAISKLSSYILSLIKRDEIHPSSINQYIPFPPPKYTESKKEYANRHEKPMKFHERGRIAQFDKKNYDIINQSNTEINLITFIGLLGNEEELDEVTVENLLNIDFEQIGDIKEKIINLIEFTKNYHTPDDKSEQYRLQLLDLLEKKKIELSANEEKIENFTINIDKVKKIIYGDKKIKVTFK